MFTGIFFFIFFYQTNMEFLMCPANSTDWLYKVHLLYWIIAIMMSMNIEQSVYKDENTYLQCRYKII